MGSVWGFIVIAGPLLLLGFAIYGWMSNRKLTRREKIESDRGTRELREELAEENDRRIDP